MTSRIIFPNIPPIIINEEALNDFSEEFKTILNTYFPDAYLSSLFKGLDKDDLSKLQQMREPLQTYIIKLIEKHNELKTEISKLDPESIKKYQQKKQAELDFLLETLSYLDTLIVRLELIAFFGADMVQEVSC